MHAEQAAGNSNLMPIHQEIEFKAAPHRIYEALLDSKQFGTVTNTAAQIHRQAGGSISIFGGLVVGRNIELIADQRIVQAWRLTEWPKGVYSIARFELKASGTGTKLIFDHAGFAPEDRGHLDEGWHKMYWEPLRKFLGE